MIDTLLSAVSWCITFLVMTDPTRSELLLPIACPDTSARPPCAFVSTVFAELGQGDVDLAWAVQAAHDALDASDAAMFAAILRAAQVQASAAAKKTRALAHASCLPMTSDWRRMSASERNDDAAKRQAAALGLDRPSIASQRART